jgi:hypothetical protein
MATNLEMQLYQRTTLFDLKRIKKANPGIVIKELDAIINRVESAMSEEEITYVEKKVVESL